ncbi:trans-aconitate 2-methyltransferase [Sphaerobacter sp.]|uniref:class I SAM-dependent methyltransferase n=1 Tax=Sphaerobacter sp. TaxID=2099654 RepID=UPI001D594886|nr:class I SAM-dependent methyltransferase [Sphaerobacter sp.]MBX5445690.1 class I SAM-dependent methyltransferase [Sphaerobacter sp.]
MDHTDHVNLLHGGVPAGPGVWADLGSGTGAFTLALADLLGPGATIYSVDRDAEALRRQERAMQARFPDTTLHLLVADFTRPLPLPPLDGIVMANSLHFVQDKEPVLHLIHGYLRPGGRLLLVEYDTDHGNRWVPYPLSYGTWETLAARAGFTGTRLLATHPSRYFHRIYSAASERGEDHARPS